MDTLAAFELGHAAWHGRFERGPPDLSNWDEALVLAERRVRRLGPAEPRGSVSLGRAAVAERAVTCIR
jgi:hypothetical protein